MGKLVPWINLLPLEGMARDHVGSGHRNLSKSNREATFQDSQGMTRKKWLALISICDPSFLVVSSQKAEMK